MYPTLIPASFARRGLTITLLLLMVAVGVALSGCDAIPRADGADKSGQTTNGTFAVNGDEQAAVGLALQSDGEGDSSPAEPPIDISGKHQWVGQVVLSEVHGIQLGTECGSWLLTFDSPELEAKAANSAGLDVIVWGYVTGIDDSDVVQSVPEQSINVESVFGSGDPIPSVYVPEYPCGGIVPPDYPVLGPIEIDLLPGEIAAMGTLVRTDDGSVYLETESGRILLKLPEVVPPVGCDDPIRDPATSPSEPFRAPDIECVVVDPAFPVEPTIPEDEPFREEILPEPDADGSGGGVVGSTGSGGTVSGGPAPSTVDSGPNQVGEGETIVVGPWSLEDGQLVIKVRYLLDRSYVYPRPVPPDAGPMPPPTETGEAGYVTGQVVIGPLCPVEPCTEEMPDVYSRHVLLLESEDGEVTKAPLQDGGYFKVELEPGTYVLSLSDCDYMGCSAALPVRIEVVAGTVQHLEFDIDTGIR